MDDSYREFIKQFLASNKAEAREWLRGGSETSFRNLGEMETDESSEFVERLYGLGAEKVLAVEIDEYPEGANTGHLLVQLPPDDSSRPTFLASSVNTLSLTDLTARQTRAKSIYILS